MPGALVEASVKHVLSDGLLLSFLAFFTGTVDQFHLAQVKTQLYILCLTHCQPLNTPAMLLHCMSQYLYILITRKFQCTQYQDRCMW